MDRSNKGMLLILSGPSGSGKGTVVKRLDPARGYAHSISVTTRPMRPGEAEGREYFFKTEREFEALRENEGLLEHALFCGNLYGTPKDYVLERIAQGKTVVLEIDVHGALQIKARFPGAALVFIIPPTRAELKRRLITRDTDSPKTIEDRLKRAGQEIQLIHRYDYLVINDDLDAAANLIDVIVQAERARPSRCQGLIDAFTEIPGDDGIC